ncbi:hypothetical protein FIBSPDRAFT_1053492 [Athelia psychrophila]|uniref:Uncharacterized protein n=1 Tax=Athelia psychrophila TaxID=1759441 RepID=A0A167WVA8_9AGAM|nr:hypothetical protein FIBSPDRAFT_1053492 [Fibularhizoctonia sp. CBS 109695]
MSLAFLLVSLSLLQTCVAPAISDATTNPSSSILDTSLSLNSSNSTPDTCNELDKCRSLVGIVTSCLATIFACVWVAVHPNIPGPNQSWASRQFESFKVIMVTLVVPEWVLAWAVRQFLQARKYSEILERARVRAAEEATLQNNRNSANEGSTRDASSSDHGSDQPVGIGLEEQSVLLQNLGRDSTESVNEVTTGELDNDRTNLVPRKSRESTQVPQEPASTLVDPWQVEGHLGRTTQSWTTAHGFLAIMGGFYYYQNGKPMFPLQVGGISTSDDRAEDYILALVQSRSLVPPTSEELGDRSKGDALSKSIAVFQTLWFVAQCIARRIENLVITNLEIMTLAYTVITVAMYTAWWHKPLNVHCPVRVKGDTVFVQKPRSFRWSDIVNYVTGDQDYLTTLRGEDRVPTFWSSCTTNTGNNLPLYADIIALAVAMVFGAVHCAAWSYVFPSLAERWTWRVCAITITAIPLPMAGAFGVFNPIDRYAISFLDYTIGFFMALGALLYIIARILLLILAFTTLHDLPLSAYKTVQWTTWIPHI